MDHYKSARSLAQLAAPEVPVTCLRPHRAKAQAQRFVAEFAATPFFAVKANPNPVLLQAIWDGGVRHFDVASLAEMMSVSAQFPGATMAFMHPIKPAHAIAKAYFDYGIRVFSLDSLEELQKIKTATNNAADLTLCVRLQVSNKEAKLSLGAKFGATPQDAPALLVAARQAAKRLGVCFHVGSQTMGPRAYSRAMTLASQLIVEAGVVVDIVDVGGGFPVTYPNMPAPDLGAYFTEIEAAFETMFVREDAELWAEPGRALVAPAASLLVRVDGRRGNTLFINDGTYGSLFDAGVPKWQFPTKRIGRKSSARQAEFSFYGPTCDDMDFMEGPFLLPADMAVGDYIEVDMLGAYGATMRTDFNGFGQSLTVVIDDEAPSVVVPLHEAQAQGL